MLGVGRFLFKFVVMKLHVRGALARVIGAGYFLSKFVFKSTPKLIWWAWVPQTQFSSFGSRDSRLGFAPQVCLKKCTETDVAGLGPFSKQRFRALVRVIGAWHVLAKVVFKTVPRQISRARVPSASIFEVWLARPALVISSLSLFPKVYRS